MYLYATDPSTVMKSEGWSEVQESHRLLTELLKLVVSRNKTYKDDTENNITIDQL